MVGSSDKIWPTGEGNGEPLQYSCLQNPMNNMNSMRSSIQLAKTRPGADYGSDHQLLTARFRLKLKKAMEKPFRYDLNQIPYDYTMEVTSRFKGIDVIEYLKNYGWRFVTSYRRQ